jgi:hypothetical protein
VDATLAPKEPAVRRSLLLPPLSLLLLLLAAAPAFAGGWATVGLSSTPAGVVTGKPWNVDITVLQHGRTPLAGIEPAVEITSGGVTREFDAKPTGKPGVYRTAVVFPTAGRWTYEVYDGFMGQMHTYPAVTIAAPQAALPQGGGDDGGIAAGWMWGAGAALLLALAVLGLDRRRQARGVVPQTPEPAA